MPFSFASSPPSESLGAIHSTKISGNFGPKLNGSVRSNRKSFGKTGPPFEVVLFSRSDRSEFWLNGSRPLKQANSLPTDVAPVRVPEAMSYVGSVSCWFSLLLREISPRVLRTYPLPQKPTFPNSNSTRNGTEERHKEPICGCATTKSLFIYLFIYFYLMFLQATFKLEPYCVMLALPRQSSFSTLNPIKAKSTAPLFSLPLRFTTQ